MRLGAELTVVGLRCGDDHQLLDASLEQATRIDAASEACERAQDLWAEAHRLDHLDRRQATLPEASALVEGWVVLDGLEGRADLLPADRDAHARLLEERCRVASIAAVANVLAHGLGKVSRTAGGGRMR